jgi:hypothetical protein
MNDISQGPVSNPARIVALLGCLTLLSLILYLVRKGALKPGYSILWFIITAIIFLLSFFNEILFWFSRTIGVDYAPSAVFSILIVGLIVIVIHFSVVLTKQERQIKTLAQESSMLKSELKKYNKKRK